MTKMNVLKISVLGMSFLLGTGIMRAQMQPQQLVPIDSAVRYGQLENGLTYYIRHNEQPKERCEFHIAQAVGAILEEDHQNGLAHFLEHMAFNGTEHFEGKGIINYFESIGVNFGGNINAYTSLDETVYRLSDVPTYREAILDSALLVLHDWSCSLLLQDDEIDAERGVIREEWRTGANANRRMWKESNKQKYPGSQYAKRDVIGDTAVINNFTYDALRDYYHKWYGPDLQGIIVVGDIDVDKMEQKIKDLFGPIPARANRGERPVYPIADNVEPIVSIVTDKEAPNARIELEYKHEPMPDALKVSMGGYVADLMSNLVSTIMGYRFDELTQKPDASFVLAVCWDGELVKSKDAFQVIAIPKPGMETEALRDILVEAEKLKRFGFTNAELERAKTDILKQYEKMYNERDNRKNIQLAQEYIRNFLDKEVIPGIEWEYQTVKEFLPLISLDVLNQMAKSLVTDENQIISIMAADKEGTDLPDKAEVLSILAEVKAMELEAPKEEVLDKELIDKAPKAGKIKKTSYNESLGTTEWTLSNGVRVVIKPTEFKQDEILMRAYSLGGMSKVNDVALLPSAMLATDIVSNNGVGNFSQIELNKVLTGKIARVSPSISDDSESMSGSSSVADFETMLQLTYLYFTAPRRDDDDYAALISFYKTALANRDADPKSAFRDSIQTTQSSHSPRTVLFNMEMLDKVDQDKAIAIYKERFAMPADFIFFFTGNIDPENEQTQRQICTWLGGLKSKKGAETYTDHGVRTPAGEVKNYFTREMQIHTASNRITYTGDLAYTLENRLNMDAIGRVLEIRYLESIREREGGSYGVGVLGTVLQRPVEQAVLIMQFDTDPEKQEKLMDIIHEEVNAIIADGPRADDLQKVKESMLKDLAEDMEENGFWHNTILYRYYIDGVDYVKDYQTAINAITAETVQATLKNLVDQGNVMEVVMMPAE